MVRYKLYLADIWVKAELPACLCFIPVDWVSPPRPTRARSEAIPVTGKHRIQYSGRPKALTKPSFSEQTECWASDYVILPRQ